jgi:hypothetical protein
VFGKKKKLCREKEVREKDVRNIVWFERKGKERHEIIYRLLLFDE